MTLQAVNSKALHKTQEKLDSYQIIAIVLKISALLEKNSYISQQAKLESTSIFKKETKSICSSKNWSAIVTLTLTTAGTACGISSSLSKAPKMTSIFNATAKLLPQLSKASSSIFDGMDQSKSSSKYLTQTHMDSHKENSQKLDRGVDQHYENLSALVRRMDSLNHLR